MARTRVKRGVEEGPSAAAAGASTGARPRRPATSHGMSMSPWCDESTTSALEAEDRPHRVVVRDAPHVPQDPVARAGRGGQAARQQVVEGVEEEVRGLTDLARGPGEPLPGQPFGHALA